jgi:hypothetical protein
LRNTLNLMLWKLFTDVFQQSDKMPKFKRMIITKVLSIHVAGSVPFKERKQAKKLINLIEQNEVGRLFV